jgi:hypothetical protein
MTLQLQKIRYRSEVKYMTVWKDKDGKSLKNSAGGMFPQPRVVPVSIGIICAEVFTTTFSEGMYKTQLNALNDTTYRDVWGEEEAWISKLHWDPDANVRGEAGHLLEYEIRLNEYKWTDCYPQCGYVYRAGSSHKTYVDSDGSPYLGLLNASGGKLPVGDDPVIDEFHYKRKISFDGLGF